MDVEKRRALRYPADFPVTCRVRGQQYEGRAVNLSRGGLLIATRDALATGAMLQISFTVPGGEPISLKALVRHASGEDGAGVEFIEVLPSQQASLASYLDRFDAAWRAAAIAPEA